MSTTATPPVTANPTPTSPAVQQYTIHPIALTFPRPSAADRESIKGSVRRNGFRAPVTAWTGPDGVAYIIDGATRIEIRDELRRDGVTHADNNAELEPEVRWFVGSELEAFNHALALFTRRDPTPSQKAATAIKAGGMARRLEAKDRGDDPAELKAEKSGELAERVAQLFGVNKSYIYDVATINEKRPDLTDKVAAGDLTIPQAKQVVKRWEAGKADFEPVGGDPEPTAPPIKAKATEVYDGLERLVHSDYAETFGARKEAARLITAISKLQKDVQALFDGPGGRCMTFQAMKTDLGNVKKHLKAHRPYIICPICAGSGEKFGGAPNEKCPTCAGRRYIDELQYSELPEPTRKELEGLAAAAAAESAAGAPATATNTPAAPELPPSVPADQPDPNATREFAPGETTPADWDATPAAPGVELSDADALAGSGLDDLPPAAAGAIDPATVPADAVPPPEDDDPFKL